MLPMNRFAASFLVISAILILMPFWGFAQNRFDALRFSTWYPAQDPVTLGFGGASASTAFTTGGILANPATASLVPSSGFSFSTSTRNISQDALYRGQTFQESDWQTSVGDISILYKFPTVTGDFTIGFGYSQLADFNRIFRYDVVNTQNTITDFFLQSSYYQPIAFEAFAIDDADGTTDLFSVWRQPFNFVGVRQEVLLEEWGSMGEITTFFATEFRKNFFLGASLGIPVGSYNYRLSFLETPPPSNNDYDVDAIFLEDEIRAEIRGVNLRLGLLYTLNESFHFGAGLARNFQYEISEEFETYISTEFTTGEFFDDSFRGQNTYNITPPTRYYAGFTVLPFEALQISVTAEFLDYSNIEMSNIGPGSIVVTENRAIRNEFQDVINLRAGIQYTASPSLTLRGGFARLPSPRKDFSAAEQLFYSAGATVKLSEDVYFDFGLQLAQWSDQNVIYEFRGGNNQQIREIVSEDITRLHAMAGIRLTF